MQNFKIKNKSKKTKARIGQLTTEHGSIETPVFMPPATRGFLKSVDSVDVVDNIKNQMLLVNTYHLYLRPGDKFVKKFGGIHKFMSFGRPILSDSGGFQVWSLNKKGEKLAKITEDGVTFRSSIDGSKHMFTPEKSIEIQHNLGVDILMAFDECTDDNFSKEKVNKVLDRSNRWLLRSCDFHQKLQKKNKTKKLLFGIAQGGVHLDLRKKALDFVNNTFVDGVALGGETIGYNMPKTKELLENLYDKFDLNRPIYTMGLGGNIQDMLDAVVRGVDMFDCVNPARLARHGELFVGKLDFKTFQIKSKEKGNVIKIGNSKYQDDKNPIEKNCDCLVCQNYSRAYLRYLYMTKEPLYFRLATIHNIYYVNKIINQLKDFIKNE